MTSTNLPFQGTYTVFADAYTKDDEPIICLEATVNFAMQIEHGT